MTDPIDNSDLRVEKERLEAEVMALRAERETGAPAEAGPWIRGLLGQGKTVEEMGQIAADAIQWLGDYRAYVGPPADYDLIARNAFCLLSRLDLRAHHRLTDIGCGSLRIGRLLIPYLDSGMYTGVEPNQWLVEEGIEKEVGNDQVRIKAPVFHFRSDAQGIPAHSQRWVLAHSIFSHTGPDLLDFWLKEMAEILSPEGSLVATFIQCAKDTAITTDTAINGWFYPDATHYSWMTIESTCAQRGLRARLLDWPHPRQSWFVATR